MTNQLAKINIELFEQSKTIVAYLKESQALPGLVQNEGQLGMVMRSFAEMGISPAEGIAALWSAHAKKWSLPDTMMIMQAGINSGLRPQEAVSGMYPVNGTATVYGATLNKLLVKSGYRVKVLAYETEKCEIALYRGEELLGQVKFNKDDATRAGLRGKAGVWKMYPQDMLYRKCMARAMKMFAPDAIGGMQVYEDVKEAMGVDEDVSEDDAIDGFETTNEIPKGAVQIGHVIPADSKHQVIGVDLSSGESKTVERVINDVTSAVIEGALEDEVITDEDVEDQIENEDDGFGETQK